MGVALSLAVALSSVTATQARHSELLQSQLNGVSSEVSSTVNSIQAPLVAADRVAESVQQLNAFRLVVSSQVGSDLAFRSMLLFDMSGAHQRLIASLGAPSDFLAAPAREQRQLLTRFAPGNSLAVVALWRAPVRALGFVEYLPGAPFPRALYAETTVPADSKLVISSSSALYGLDFAMYLGSSTVRRTLIESTVRTPVRGVTASTTVPFGTQFVTVISVLKGAEAAQLFAGTPRSILLWGSLLALLCAVAVQWFAHRRQLAAGHVLHSTQQLHAERTVSQTLQRALLPDEYLEFDGVEIAAAYRAGTANLEVGGDWYDAIGVDEDTVVFAVGDVSGRGLRAATVMSSLRHAIRAYAVRGDDPATILQGLGPLVQIERDHCFATVLIMKLTVSSGVLTVASAGHLAPVIGDESGSRLIELHVSPPVGVNSGSVVSALTTTLSRGALLLAYTDGLVERRSELIDDGLGRLVRSVDPTAPSIDRLIDSLMETMVPATLGDDVAVLAVRTLVGDRVRSYSRQFAGDALAVEHSRRFLERVARSLSTQILDAAVLTLSELATNAVVHAQSPFRVRVDVTATGSLRLAVTNTGGTAPVARASTAGESGGRGLLIVGQMAQRWGVEISHDLSSTTVWAEFDGVEI